MSMPSHDFNIADLVDDLQPVRPMQPGRTMLISLFIIAGLIVANAGYLGMRPDLYAGNPAEMFLLRAGTLLLLGIVCARSLIAMASPSVGKHNDGWKIALAGAGLFPIAAIMALFFSGGVKTANHLDAGMQCLTMSVIGGLAVAINFVVVLRRGAPVSPKRAGWLTGVASGALGAFAYNFHCPFNSLIYIGFWYSLSIGICAVIGRLVVPRLIRW